MPWGSHVCQFYDGKGDLTEMLVPYFKQGLERNEVCVWLVADLTVGEAKNALKAAVPDLERHMLRGQMHSADGYTGLRASGDMSWVNTEDVPRLRLLHRGAAV